MPKFSANLGFLWPELDLPDRIHAAHQHGFSAVECHFPYETPVHEVTDALQSTNLQMLGLNTSPGDLNAGEFGLCALPGKQDAARQVIDQAIEYASAIGCFNVHVMAGVYPNEEVGMQVFGENLLYAASAAAAQNINILIEPINRVDRPDYVLHRVSQAVELIDQLVNQNGVNNIRLMFDCYHVQMTDGRILPHLQAAMPHIGHIQIASVPGRGEPAWGEINYPWLFQQIDQSGYSGYVGAEYIPGRATENTLGWMNHWAEEKTSPEETRIYRDYSQTKLDAEYHNSGKVSDANKVIEWYTAESMRYREVCIGQFDLRYGQTEAETLDLIFPNGKPGQESDDRPVHVFFHGGYWQALHKKDFTGVSQGFADTDAIVVIVNYALIPEVSMDELVKQCRHSLAWLYKNVKQFGGNPGRISISGHSAGGHLVAMMMATDWPAFDSDLPLYLVRSGVSISGLHDLEPIRLCYLNKVLQLDSESAERNSPVLHENLNTSSLLCLYGDLEGSEYRNQSESLACLWKSTRAMSVAGHHHFSLARSLYFPDSDISRIVKSHCAIQIG